ncbi:branched-chain amino acid ABC transporter substrate-binding protein [Ideonella sp. DXS29W]|uniref:Branched-chain amino acid ABC transporter substrate-binding protein n=1 Tax=Ideonella lacteola TaxID=2984193 RepID=A0ABU9BZG9_9BURK
MVNRRSWSLAVGAALLWQAGLACAQAGETVKIAFIDPQSGPFANIGQNILRTFQLAAERTSAKSGVKFEVVAFDNKASPQESLNVLKAAIDQGFRYVAQGNGSGAAAAILDAVNKHNERNPGKEVVFLNYAAVDPDLTNSKCSFWHFRFDADTSMKMEAMVTAMSEDPTVKKVYIIGQNYAHGQQVSRYAKEIIARKTPAIQVVGDELHPLGQVKDFAPYIAKIKQSGADTVITGNWGQDLALLIKAAKDSGLEAKWYTYYAGAQGTPTAIGNALTGKITTMYGSYSNLPGEYSQFRDAFQAKYKQDFSTSTVLHLFATLQGGIAKAKSTDPVKVAQAMEGLTVRSYAGDVTMRASDHQLQQSLFFATWQKVDAKQNYNVEETGNTFALTKMYPAYVSATPTSCQMKRP